MNVAALLAEPGLPPLERRILLAHASGRDRVFFASHPEWVIPDSILASFRQLVDQRQAGFPIAYLVGTREFYGYPLKVTPAVLIPRPETEGLVDEALAWLRTRPGRPAVLDLGCGSGAIAIAIALQCPRAAVTAVDLSNEALMVAKTNGDALGANVRWLRSDWYTSIPGQLFDLIVANPPYIAVDDAHLQQGDLRYEPAMALTDGSDGLQALNRVISGAPGYLSSDGVLMVEHGYDQGTAVLQAMAQHGLQNVRQVRDLAGHVRLTRATGPASAIGAAPLK